MVNKAFSYPIPCRAQCGRLLRPANTTEQEYPGTHATNAGKGLCGACYHRARRAARGETTPQDTREGAQDSPEDVLGLTTEGLIPIIRRTQEDYYYKPAKPGLWALQGLCNDDPDGFFERSVVDAKKICRQCPVRRECAEMAITNEEQWGVWGGLSRQDRKKVINGTITLDEALNEKPRAQAGLESHEEHVDRLVGVS